MFDDVLDAIRNAFIILFVSVVVLTLVVIGLIVALVMK